MFRKTRFVFCFAPALVLAAPPLAAQEQQAPAASQEQGMQRAEEAFRSYQEARSESGRLNAEARRALAEAKGDPDARAEFNRVTAEARRKLGQAQEAFLEAFLLVDRKAWSAESQARLLEDGLMLTGSEALERGDADAAAEALEALRARLPECGSISSVESSLLPKAWIGQGDLAAAAHKLHALSESSREQVRPAVLLQLGDVLAAMGEVQKGRIAYSQARELVPDGTSSRDPRARAARDAGMRLALVGKPAPDLVTRTWIGAEPRALSEFAGSVVILDFWATWCPPCRDVMPGFDDLYRKHSAEGLQVLGVTRFYSNGFLPESRSAMQSGERVSEIPESDFVDHLNDFRARTGIAYPFLVVHQEDFARYRVTGIPTVALVDKQGQVRLVLVGSGHHALLEQAVEHALRAPAPAETGR